MNRAHPRMESLGEHQAPEEPPQERSRYPTLPLSFKDISALHRNGLISTSHS